MEIQHLQSSPLPYRPIRAPKRVMSRVGLTMIYILYKSACSFIKFRVITQSIVLRQATLQYDTFV